MIARLKFWARRLKLEIQALYLATQEPEVPWYAKAMALAIVAYAFSPLDLIPDPIPILGYLDDLILLPLGIYVVIRLIPAEILEDCRRRARQSGSLHSPIAGWITGGIIILLWVVSFIVVLYLLRRFIAF